MKFAAVAVMIVCLARSARAWENTCSHPQISKNAVALLPMDLELQAFVTQIAAGSTNEDTPTPVVADHFYDPRTRLPLYIAGDSTSNALIQVGALLATGSPQTDALSRGGGKFLLAVGKYNGSFGFVDKPGAYETLGHALHLLTQDMAQPGHVENDEVGN